MSPDLPPSIRQLIDYGIKTVDPDRVILFGSRARGDARENSDYDLAFDFPPDTTTILASLCYRSGRSSHYFAAH